MEVTNALAEFPTNKEVVKTLGDIVITGVKEGSLDPLEVMLQLKAIEVFGKYVRDNVNDNVLVAASLHSADKPFIYRGATMQIRAVSTTYYFSGCNDPVYLDLLNELEAIEDKVKARETFLKNLDGTVSVVIGDEIVNINPPRKNQKEGITIKL